MLSDRDIYRAQQLGLITIRPFRDERVQPASYDLALGERFLDVDGCTIVLPAGLQPGQFVLGETAEVITLSAEMAARIEGKSSLGRKGLMVHVTAGFIDPGFHGKLTLELCNLSDRPIPLTPGMPISQLSFTRLSSEACRPYGHPDLKSKYQNADGVEASKG